MKPKDRQWTIMVYMAGDNNLSEDMIRAIVETRRRILQVGHKIKESTKKNKISLLLEFDGEHPLVPAKRYDLTIDLKKLDQFALTSEPVDIPDEPRTPAQHPTGPLGLTERRICDFITDARALRPAENYALILSGHMDAFLGRTLLFDQDPSGTSTLQGICTAIKQVFPEKLDLLGFDGCVMNSLEVAHEFSDAATTWIGSQGSIPNFTWDYCEIIDRLMRTDKQDLSVTTVTKAIIAEVKEYNCPFSVGGRAVDISVIDLTKVKVFGQSLNNVAGLLALVLYACRSSLAGSRLMEVMLQAHWNCQTAMFDQSIDLIDYFQRLEKGCSRAIRQLLDIDPTLNNGEVNEKPLSERDLAAILESAQPDQSEQSTQSVVNLPPVLVLAFVHLLTTLLLKKTDGLVKRGIFIGPDARYCRGLSLFLPWSFVAFRMARSEYRKLTFNTDCIGWYLFVVFHAALTARPRVGIRIPLKRKREIFADLGSLALAMRQLRGRTSKAGSVPFLEGLTISIVESFIQKIDLDVKISPPYNKGMDSYIHRFGRTNNLRPDLNISGKFPPRKESGICNSFRKS